MRTALASLLVVCIATGTLAWATDGFRVLTSEQARRLAVSERPVAVPDVGLRMDNGARQSLRDLLHDEGARSIVGFFYSRCTSICITLGNDFRQLQQRIVDEGLEGRVKLLSISFDTQADTAAVLRDYRERMRARDNIWQIAAAQDGQELAVLLESFGVTVIDDGRGGFVHNSAYHIVNARGELEAIVDLAKPLAALRAARGRRHEA
ncbi:SCO family protein [Parahaliea mediterranea]|uniref:SCO family protein n=1 Tax=Parahaliea mediterranea TaxID=651086 RepID=A0A939DDI5_9GAMM|nr:SCO family protein [Parahaliea mediterranea]MBN7796099.1 SCO family protein [Parahaliea mediterranea]